MKWLADNWKVVASAALILFCVGMAKLASYYHGQYVTADSLATERQQTIDDMTVRQRDVAALDAKYTKELTDANTENDRLRAKLASGGRVRVAGECKPQSSTAGSVGNAGTVELSPVAGSNVLSIRAGIISDQAKVRYLQQYIVEQCQNK